MTTMTRQLLGTLRTDIEAAVQAVAKKHGVIINAGTGTFNPTEGTASLRLEMAVARADLAEGTKVQDIKQAQDWDHYATSFGLKPEWKGKSFPSNGHVFTIKGLEPRRTARPVVATREDGKSFIFPVDAICMRMKAIDTSATVLGRKTTAKA